MEYNIILFSFLVTFMSKSNCELIGSPVININGCCSSQTTGVNCDEQNKQLLANITNILKEYNEGFKTNLGSLDSVYRSRDCQDIQHLGHGTTGVYTIYPEGTMGFPVRCDMDTTNGGWTVIQRRVSYSDFYKTWNEYQIGFGNLSANFWLGNQQIHAVSSQGWYELRIDLVSLAGGAAYAEYKVFSVSDVDSGYKLSVDGYSGNAGDSLPHHNGRKFSTKDKDNDDSNSQCAQLYTGAWWYGDCHESNLNGKYGEVANRGPRWTTFKGEEPMKQTEMKIRRWKPSVKEFL